MSKNALDIGKVDDFKRLQPLDMDIEEFNDLMRETAKLPAGARKLVAVYTQGVIAMASMMTQVENESKSAPTATA